MSHWSLSQVSEEEIAELHASGDFDSTWYLKEYPDVALVGIDPARHFLWIGRHLGRSTKAPAFETGGHEAAITIDRPVRCRIDRAAPILSGEDWLIFVAYSADGALTDCQRYQISCFASSGYHVALVINSDRFDDLVDPRCEDAKILMIRENLGYDFGAWRHAVETLGGLKFAHSLSFTNDSILPVSADGAALGEMRRRVAQCGLDVAFLTQNQEVRSHCQSYFFTLGAQALERGGLDQIASVPLYVEKENLIHEVELHLADRLEDASLTTGPLFDLAVEENPTIHYWEDLLDMGFPFIKIQLITAGIIGLDDPRLKQRLPAAVHAMLEDHCERRNGLPARPSYQQSGLPRPALPVPALFNEYGAQQAINPAASLFPTIRVPLQGLSAFVNDAPKVLAVIHGFYTDLLPRILQQVRDMAIDIRVLITTDTLEKRAQAEEILAAHGLDGRAVLCENRGRDVAPFLIEGGKYLDDAEIILHLHTKKSPHDGVYAGWGEFLRENLIGSSAIARSVLEILQQSNVGLIYSDHFPAVNDLRNWGYDFDHADNLLKRIGCDISADTPLEFPTSTMMWARREALQPLFDLGLTYEDFEPEEGQIDGTLAHAIERSLLYICEHQGFSHAKVTSLDTPTDPGGALMHLRADSVSYALNRPIPRLNGGLTLRSEFYDNVPEIYPVGVASSRNKRLRLNAILPTMKPEKIYGGITTAIAVIRQIADQMPADVDLRVLITSDTVDRPSIEALVARLDRPFTRANPQDDIAGNSIVGVAEAQQSPISLREREMYISTAWWTADLGFRLMDQQRTLFAADPVMAYIIQDFEPGFYNWSNHYAMADATYHRPSETLAIINSEELAGYMQSRYSFLEKQYVPYALHPVLEKLIEPTRPEKLILAYGRPSVSRNCFELLREGLRVWQRRDPRRNSEFEIVFAGEDFDQALLSGLENARTAGKASIEEYAAMLNRACAGVSLMVSPHPSYPPLEMANAGCMTVTNRYEGKDLCQRSDRFVSLGSMSPDALADALDVAVNEVDFSATKPVLTVRDLEIDMAKVDYAKLASMMLSRAGAA